MHEGLRVSWRDYCRFLEGNLTGDVNVKQVDLPVYPNKRALRVKRQRGVVYVHAVLARLFFCLDHLLLRGVTCLDQGAGRGRTALGDGPADEVDVCVPGHGAQGHEAGVLLAVWAAGLLALRARRHALGVLMEPAALERRVEALGQHH